MIITLSPVRKDGSLEAAASGDVARIDGLIYDFTALAEGEVLPRLAVDCAALLSDVTRIGGQVRLTLCLPVAADDGDDKWFPEPITDDTPGLTGPDGGIDWQRKITQSAKVAAALAEWRASASVSRADFCEALVAAGILSLADGIAAAKGDIPAAFEPVIAAMPAQVQPRIRIRWAAMSSVERLNPLILAVAQAANIPDPVLDQVFGWT